MDQVEYRIERITTNGGGSPQAQVVERLDELGREGWRVRSADLAGHPSFASRPVTCLRAHGGHPSRRVPDRGGGVRRSGVDGGAAARTAGPARARGWRATSVDLAGHPSFGPRVVPILLGSATDPPRCAPGEQPEPRPPATRPPRRRRRTHGRGARRGQIGPYEPVPTTTGTMGRVTRDEAASSVRSRRHGTTAAAARDASALCRAVAIREAHAACAEGGSHHGSIPAPRPAAPSARRRRHRGRAARGARVGPAGHAVRGRRRPLVSRHDRRGPGRRRAGPRRVRRELPVARPRGRLEGRLARDVRRRRRGRHEAGRHDDVRPGVRQQDRARRRAHAARGCREDLARPAGRRLRPRLHDGVAGVPAHHRADAPEPHRRPPRIRLRERDDDRPVRRVPGAAPAWPADRASRRRPRGR